MIYLFDKNILLYLTESCLRCSDILVNFAAFIVTIDLILIDNNCQLWLFCNGIQSDTQSLIIIHSTLCAGRENVLSDRFFPLS